MFWLQFKTMAERNACINCISVTHQITTLNELVAQILYGIPTGVTYKEVSAWESLGRSPPGSCDPCSAEEKHPACQGISAGICHHHTPFGSPCPSQTTRACDQYRSGLCIHQQEKKYKQPCLGGNKILNEAFRQSGMARRSQVSFGGELTASQLPSSKNVSTGTQACPPSNNQWSHWSLTVCSSDF